MSTKKKLLQAAAGSAGGAGLDVDEVFSTYLYTGNESNLTITNGIDLSGEGGLVWAKHRDNNGYDNVLQDTERGAGKNLKSNSTGAETTFTDAISSFNSDGFSFTGGGGSLWNQNNGNFVSWTWRKAPKFFDVVTYTGNGSTQNISHNLGSVPGMIIIKCTSRSGDFWNVYHRSLGNNKRLLLQSTINAGTSGDFLNSTDPTSTQFTVGQESDVNASGQTYVAYLFAHNDGDGEFGPDSDQDIIKCGSYTGNGSTQDIDLGFEAQWVMIKPTSTTGNWNMMDVMRGMPTSGLEAVRLYANTSDAEGSLNSSYGMRALETGFTIDGLTANDYNKSGETYIYMAIRRGPLAEPESATDVFAIDQGDTTSTDPQFISNFPVDMAITRYVAGSAEHNLGSRLTGATYGQTQNTNAFSGDNDFTWDYMNGWYASTRNTSHYSWMWKRAPSYFDVVAYTGDGSGVRTINHNLGVAPEMIWIKGRNATMSWIVYHASLGNDYVMRLEQTSAASSGSSLYWNNTDPTSSVWTINSNLNTSGRNYIAYLFATVAGVSSVGSYSGNGSTTGPIVDCGFSSGARFVLIKRTDSTGDWVVHDTVRGITAGDDKTLKLNSTAAETTGQVLNPHSSGFQLATADSFANASGGTYIYYAIA